MAEGTIMPDEAQIRDFFARVRGIAEATRLAGSAIARAVAPRFCPVALFYPNETDLSRVLAFLIDPTANHGQGTMFLRLFLDVVGLPECDDREDGIDVSTEYVLSPSLRRADIAVSYTRLDRQRIHLLIENKPWAGDGVDQLSDYSKYLKTKYQSTPWAIVYIPSTERDPGAHSVDENCFQTLIANRSLFILPYVSKQRERSIQEWLKRCEATCEAEEPRRFIGAFRRYLAENVPDTGVVQMSDAERSVAQILLKFLQERDEDINIALEVPKALASLRNDLAKKIGDRITEGIRSRLQGGDWQIESNFTTEQWAGLGIYRSRWPKGMTKKNQESQCFVGIEFHGSFKQAHYGVAGHRDMLGELRGPIREAASEYLRLAGDRDWWPAILNFEQPLADWLSDEFLHFARRVLRDEEESSAVVNNLVTCIVEVAKKVDEVVTRMQPDKA